MNAPNLHELRGISSNENAPDNRMDEVRELLIGDHIRDTEARLAALARRIDTLELSAMTRQLEGFAARLEILANETDADRRAAFQELSQHVESLAESIRSLTKP